MRLCRAIVAAAAVVLMISCGPKSLDPRGEVNLWIPQEMEELQAVADSIDGLSLNVTVAGESWLSRLKEENNPPALVYTDLNNDVTEGFDAGLMLDLSPYLDRMQVAERMLAGFAGLSATDTGTRLFLPAAAYSWGLYYNVEILASHGVHITDNWDEWLAALEKLKNADVVPIALGSSFGWPALAWVSYLDLRINGGAMHAQLLDGARSFDDPSMLTVYRTLEQWRDKGYFNTDASKMNWPESLELVGSGQAAFVLMGTFCEARMPNREQIAFAPVPVAGNEEDRGELAGIEGFAVAGGAPAPEAALALADRYIAAGEPRPTKAGYIISVIEPQDDTSARRDDLAAVQTEIFESADIVVPQLDRYLPAQAAYDINRVLARFFDPGFDMSADNLARILTNIRP